MSTNKTTDVSGLAWQAVVLRWNGRQDTLRCLESLSRIERSDLGIICMDNGSTDGSAEAVRDRFPEVTVIQAGENLGYAGGNNNCATRWSRGPVGWCWSTTTPRSPPT